jgi:hypothetical protein
MSLPLSTAADSFLSACTPSCRPNVLRLQAVRVLLFIDHSSFRSLEYPYVDTPTHSVSLDFYITPHIDTDPQRRHNPAPQLATTGAYNRENSSVETARRKIDMTFAHREQTSRRFEFPSTLPPTNLICPPLFNAQALDLCTHLSNNCIFAQQAQVNHSTC